jgi:alanyl-tRNA synthetase
MYYDEEIEMITISHCEKVSTLILLVCRTYRSRIKVIVFVGEESRKIIKASRIAKEISLKLGGTGGGGTDKFAQGGGRDKSKIDDCLKNLDKQLTDILDSSEKNG